jgi:hypothetical protein
MQIWGSNCGQISSFRNAPKLSAEHPILSIIYYSDEKESFWKINWKAIPKQFRRKTEKSKDQQPWLEDWYFKWWADKVDGSKHWYCAIDKLFQLWPKNHRIKGLNDSIKPITKIGRISPRWEPKESKLSIINFLGSLN